MTVEWYSEYRSSRGSGVLGRRCGLGKLLYWRVLSSVSGGLDEALSVLDGLDEVGHVS